MDANTATVARICLDGAIANTLTFPQILGVLGEAGFESYVADLRRGVITYYLPTGESVELDSHPVDAAVAPQLDAASVQGAIRQAQAMAPGYSYKGFCKTVMQAGVASYMVSLSGRRAVYFGRTGETHVEMFPGQA